MTAFASRDVSIGPWTPAVDARTDDPPPHRLPHESRASLSAIYADRERTVVLAVTDYDGCFALATPPPALDVERLAAAFEVNHFRFDAVYDWLTFAAIIAAEYARLGGSPNADTQTDIRNHDEDGNHVP